MAGTPIIGPPAEVPPGSRDVAARQQRGVPALLGLLLALATPAIAQVPITGTASPADATGAYTIELDLEDYMPVWVHPPAYSELTYRYQLPPDLTIRRVWIFYGTGRAHLFEGHVLVTANGFRLANYGPHRERSSDYDAWRPYEVNYTAGAGGAYIDVHALCSPTAGKKVQYHVGVILEVAPAPTPQ